MGRRLLVQRLPALLPTKNQTAHLRTRSEDASFALWCARNQDTGEAAELFAIDSAAEKSTKWPDGVPVYLHTDTHTHTHTRSWAGAVTDYLRCLLWITRHSGVPARILSRASTAAVPTCVAPNRPPALDVYLHTYLENWCRAFEQPSLAVYLHTYLSEPAHPYQRCLPSTPALDTYRHGYIWARGTALTGFASHRQAALHKYLPACSEKLAQRLPALHPAENRPQLCRASWRSAYWQCILLTTGPGGVPSRTLGRPCSPPTNASWSCFLITIGLTCVPVLVLGRACWPRTDIASCRQPPMDCTNTRASWCGLTCVPSLDKRPWTSTCSRDSSSRRSTYQPCVLLTLCSDWSWASWRSGCRHCLQLTTGPAVYPHACQGDLASCRQPAMDTCLHLYTGELVQAYRRRLLMTCGPGHVPVHVLQRAGAAPTGVE